MKNYISFMMFCFIIVGCVSGDDENSGLSTRSSNLSEATIRAEGLRQLYDIDEFIDLDLFLELETGRTLSISSNQIRAELNNEEIDSELLLSRKIGFDREGVNFLYIEVETDEYTGRSLKVFDVIKGLNQSEDRRFIHGDVNGNGLVEQGDYDELNQFLQGGVDIEKISFSSADLNIDGRSDEEDLKLIQDLIESGNHVPDRIYSDAVKPFDKIVFSTSDFNDGSQLVSFRLNGRHIVTYTPLLGYGFVDISPEDLDGLSGVVDVSVYVNNSKVLSRELRVVSQELETGGFESDIEGLVRSLNIISEEFNKDLEQSHNTTLLRDALGEIYSDLNDNIVKVVSGFEPGNKFSLESIEKLRLIVPPPEQLSNFGVLSSCEVPALHKVNSLLESFDLMKKIAEGASISCYVSVFNPTLFNACVDAISVIEESSQLGSVLADMLPRIKSGSNSLVVRSSSDIVSFLPSEDFSLITFSAKIDNSNFCQVSIDGLVDKVGDEIVDAIGSIVADKLIKNGVFESRAFLSVLNKLKIVVSKKSVNTLVDHYLNKRKKFREMVDSIVEKSISGSINRLAEFIRDESGIVELCDELTRNLPPSSEDIPIKACAIEYDHRAGPKGVERVVELDGDAYRYPYPDVCIQKSRPQDNSVYDFSLPALGWLSFIKGDNAVEGTEVFLHEPDRYCGIWSYTWTPAISKIESDEPLFKCEVEQEDGNIDVAQDWGSSSYVITAGFFNGEVRHSFSTDPLVMEDDYFVEEANFDFLEELRVTFNTNDKASSEGQWLYRLLDRRTVDAGVIVGSCEGNSNAEAVRLIK